MSRMHSPAHPGQILEELYIKPHQLAITEVAGALGIARKNLYAILKGDYAISVEMAFKLSKAFDTTPEFWLQAQLHFDLAKGYKESASMKIKSLIPKSTKNVK
jgi:addiction module HigA family antidote